MDKYGNYNDPYIYPNTDVLKNKKNIRDFDILQKVERDTSIIRATELAKRPIQGNFDLKHLQKIHKKLFGDIYEWAGELRTVDISKGSSRFAHTPYIQSFLDDTFRKLEKENYLKDIGIDKFSERAAFYMGEINAAHPFREGNGRTMREFISQLAKTNNYKISWDNINQEDMIKASIHSMNGDNRFLANLIRGNTVQTNKAENLSAAELFARMAAMAAKKGEAVTIHKPVEQAQIKPKQGCEAQTETQSNKQKPKL